MPLFIVAGTVVALGAAAVAAVMTLPDTPDKKTPAAVDSATPAAPTAASDDSPSSTGEGHGSDYWTADRMRSAKPLPTPKISDEAYEKLIGSKKKKKPN
jgi:hypothetical protein